MICVIHHWRYISCAVSAVFWSLIVCVCFAVCSAVSVVRNPYDGIGWCRGMLLMQNWLRLLQLNRTRYTVSVPYLYSSIDSNNSTSAWQHHRAASLKLIVATIVTFAATQSLLIICQWHLQTCSLTSAQHRSVTQESIWATYASRELDEECRLIRTPYFTLFCYGVIHLQYNESRRGREVNSFTVLLNRTPLLCFTMVKYIYSTTRAGAAEKRRAEQPVGEGHTCYSTERETG